MQIDKNGFVIFEAETGKVLFEFKRPRFTLKDGIRVYLSQVIADIKWKIREVRGNGNIVYKEI